MAATRRKQEIIGRWSMDDNKLDADPLIDLAKSFLATEPLLSLAKASVRPSSPVINAGRRDAPAFDFFCNPRDAQVDVGPNSTDDDDHPLGRAGIQPLRPPVPLLPFSCSMDLFHAQDKRRLRRYMIVAMTSHWFHTG